MGYHINAQTDLKNEYVRAVEKWVDYYFDYYFMGKPGHSIKQMIDYHGRITSIVQTRFTNIWISLDPIFRRTSLGKEHQQALDIIHGFVDKVRRE